MKRPSIRQFLAVAVLGLLLAVVAALVLLGSNWGRREITRQARARIAQNSDLVLAPFEVEFSWLRDFPHITASLHHVSLTDTAFQRAIPVLQIGRADLRLRLSQLLLGRVQINRLAVYDAEFRQLTDSLGHNWGLHGKGPHRAAAFTPPDFNLDSLLLYKVRVTDRNELQNSGFSAYVRRGGLAVRARGGVANVRGTLDAQLEYLRSGRGNLFEQEPVMAWIRYRYDFGRRQGNFLRTHATLNGDTVLVTGTHQAAAPGAPRGTTLNLKFVGRQPLVEVLHVALPTNLHHFLTGATSASHARIQYTIQGLSGPSARPRTILRFQLQNAQMRWPDSVRQIRRWDARGVFDNGPEHSSRTTYLSFEQCRLYSTAGELNARIKVQDFTHPFLTGHVQGRTELQTLATVVVPGLWKARSGQAALNIHFNGLLPEIPERTARRAGQTATATLSPLAARGTVTLENASLLVPSHGADMSGLNVRVRLRDSLWILENLAGRLNGMQVQANATTTYLLAYFSGQHPSTDIKGTFTVDELHLGRLRQLLAPPVGHARAAAPRIRRPGRPRNQELAARAMNLLPPGLHLYIRLRCQRLLLPTDTLFQLAATVRHDGRQVQLSNLQMHVWSGQVKGAISWPTDTLHLQPVAARLAAHFQTIEYRRLLALLHRPVRPAPSNNADPSLQEVLLAANGQAEVSIQNLQLPAGENLTDMRLRLNKTGRNFRIPYLTFGTSAGGTGRVSAMARLNGTELQSAKADIDLRYSELDVQRLFQLLAALTPPSRKAPDAPPTKAPAGGSSLLDGTVAAKVRVSADRVRYAALQGSNFQLRSSLENGWANLDECSLQSFGGSINLRGRVQMDAEAGSQHPLHAQVRLKNINLTPLFGVAAALNLDVMGPENIRGTMQCEGDLHTTLDAAFLPSLSQTHAYLKTDLRELELMDVTALQQALKFLRDKRTSHLYFEPVSPRFILDGTRLLIPDLHLNSNLTDMAISGEYQLDGRANLYVGLSPMQTLFGNNKKRIERIQSGEATEQPSRGLVYVNLHRTPGSRYKVRPFQKQEQRQQQEQLRREFQQLLIRQPLDTTLRLLQ
ncbi:AsmA-like C-terminal region [Hymenobacter gelipurpurascens]|uniref:AsmA-like C-terminal region n=1 Tax=Hymenobacter gelipurpurascens TaxID=89968 RepID=A0A212TIJ9_9BACT|nr:AsmA-like C-terminal region-containing protein [Hymenobacter gelipurpurascens]SNC65700.1 AsmA-like C-terminal region [Hymenobacter gelipurpurascens]